VIEEKGVMDLLNFFLEMPNLDKKMMLYIMPQNLKECPTDFKDLKDGKFWMVNV